MSIRHIFFLIDSFLVILSNLLKIYFSFSDISPSDLKMLRLFALILAIAVISEADVLRRREYERRGDTLDARAIDSLRNELNSRAFLPLGSQCFTNVQCNLNKNQYCGWSWRCEQGK